MRKIKEWIYKFDNVNVKPISILGGIGFSILFIIVLTITTLLGMFIITPVLETIEAVQIINGISEIGVQILAYCATITIGVFIMFTCYKGMKLKDRYKESLKEVF